MKSSSLIVREAQSGDLEPLARLFDEYRQFYEQASDLEGARRFLAERGSRHESVVFLAIDSVSGTAVGFTQLYPSFSSISMKRVWILNDLYVREEYRNRARRSCSWKQPNPTLSGRTRKAWSCRRR